MDLTIVNSRPLKNVNDWEISEGESCSDHSIIKFNLGHESNHATQHKPQRAQIRYKRTKLQV